MKKIVAPMQQDIQYSSTRCGGIILK